MDLILFMMRVAMTAMTIVTIAKAARDQMISLKILSLISFHCMLCRIIHGTATFSTNALSVVRAS